MIKIIIKFINIWIRILHNLIKLRIDNYDINIKYIIIIIIISVQIINMRIITHYLYNIEINLH